MPSYVYTAKNPAAQTVTGRVVAQNSDEAFETIHRDGLVPVSIEEETSQGVLVSSIREQRIKFKERYLFTKQLSGLIKSGVPLLRSLEVITGQTRNPYFAKITADITMGVKSGRSLSACLGDYPAIFSSLYVSMVKVGEEMGHLREVLGDLAVYQRKQEELASKIRGAMVYPLVMLGVGGLTVFFILTFVMPKIATIFSGTNQTLPLPTTVVMGISHFFQMYWLPLLSAAAGSGILAYRWLRSASGTNVMGRWVLHLPYLRDLVLKADLGRLTRTMHLLLDSGLPLIRAIEVGAATMENPQLRADVYASCEGLSGGENFGTCIRKSAYIPPLVVQALSVAEEGGELQEALKDIAESCESDVADAIKAMTALLEPVMILLVGSVVGFIIFAMLLPIFSMDMLAS